MLDFIGNLRGLRPSTPAKTAPQHSQALPQADSAKPAATISKLPGAGNPALLPARSAAASSVPPNAQALGQAVQSINGYFQNAKRALELKLDDSTEQVVVHVRDAETQELIRKIRPDEAMKLLSEVRAGQGLSGTGLSEKA